MTSTPSFPEEVMGELLGDFLDESGHLIGRLNECLLALDQMVRENPAEALAAGDSAMLLNDMFRAAHSLKGLSGMLGLREINELTHRMENVFDAARKHQLVLDARAVDLLFRAVDTLSELVEALRRGEITAGDSAAIVDAIRQLLQEAGVERGVSSQEDAERILEQLSQLDNLVGQLETDAANRQQPDKSLGEPSAARCPAEESAVSSEGQGPLSLPAEPAADVDLPQTAAGQQKGEPSGRSWEAPAAEMEGKVISPPTELVGEDPFAGIVDEDLAASAAASYLPIFVDEARSTLDEFHELLLAGEESGEPRDVEKLMIVAHRLKGAAAAVGLRRAAKVAHLAEDILQSLGERRQPLAGCHLDVLLPVVDALRAYVDQLAKGQSAAELLREPAQRLALLKCELDKAEAELQACTHSALGTDPPARLEEAKGDGGRMPSPNCSADVPPQFRPQWSEAASSLLPREWETRTGYVGVVLFRPQLQLAGLKARLVVEKLTAVGEVTYCFPKAEELEEADSLDGLVFACWSDASEEALRRQLTLGGVERVIVTTHRASGEASVCKHDPSPAVGIPADEQAGESSDNAQGHSYTEAAPASVGPAGADSADEVSPRSAGATSSSGKASGPEEKAVGSSPQVQSVGISPSTGASVGRLAPQGPQVTETLRVDIERLDELMNLTGELVIQRARLNQLVENLRAKMAGSSLLQLVRSLKEYFGRIHMGGNGAMGAAGAGSASQAKAIWSVIEQLEAEQRGWLELRSLSNELRVSVHQLDRITDRLQQTVMNTRMVPIGPLFHRFKRVVRDLVRTSGKQIRLVILGEKTELDKRMIDELADPLIHLVRNAADHGIEPPAERLRLGKPAEGTLVLEACHKGNAIIIRVSDDGRGLDAEKIRRKAVERGFLSPAEAERLSPQEVYQLIWRPGLSTAEKVTEISGRGMGMDIVKAKIEALNGTVEVYTEPGRGTTFTIKLPLTLAILPSLLVRVEANTFALPVDTIVEIVQFAPEQIATVQGAPTAVVRGRVIPICRLQDLFVWNGSSGLECYRDVHSREAGSEQSGRVTLVVLGDRQREIALEVDHVIGEEDLVIKSLAENYRNIPGLTGASILGDGSVALILDVTALVEMACNASAGRW